MTAWRDLERHLAVQESAFWQAVRVTVDTKAVTVLRAQRKEDSGRVLTDPERSERRRYEGGEWEPVRSNEAGAQDPPAEDEGPLLSRAAVLDIGGSDEFGIEVVDRIGVRRYIPGWVDGSIGTGRRDPAGNGSDPPFPGERLTTRGGSDDPLPDPEELVEIGPIGRDATALRWRTTRTRRTGRAALLTDGTFGSGIGWKAGDGTGDQRRADRQDPDKVTGPGQIRFPLEQDNYCNTPKVI